MADRSHLVRTSITDQTGKQTTVYRRPDAAPEKVGRPMPAPSLGRRPSKDKRSADYADRLAGIAATNESWRSGQHPGISSAAAAAMPRAGELMVLVARSRPHDVTSQVGTRFERACAEQRFTTVEIAHRFSFIPAIGMPGWGEKAPERIDPDRYASGSSAAFGHRGLWPIAVTMAVTDTLHALDLLSMEDVPELGDARMAGHLWMAARGLDYATPKVKDKAIIRLIDEFPERVDEINQFKDSGMTPAQLRRTLVAVPAALSSGIL